MWYVRTGWYDEEEISRGRRGSGGVMVVMSDTSFITCCEVAKQRKKRFQAPMHAGICFRCITACERGHSCFYQAKQLGGLANDKTNSCHKQCSTCDAFARTPGGLHEMKSKWDTPFVVNIAEGLLRTPASTMTRVAHSELAQQPVAGVVAVQDSVWDLWL